MIFDLFIQQLCFESSKLVLIDRSIIRTWHILQIVLYKYIFIFQSIQSLSIALKERKTLRKTLNLPCIYFLFIFICNNFNWLNKVFFFNCHIHKSFSFDTWAMFIMILWSVSLSWYLTHLYRLLKETFHCKIISLNLWGHIEVP